MTEGLLCLTKHILREYLTNMTDVARVGQVNTIKP